jgi:predicted GH43/DUF377 family glycosyl hydrolase
MKVTSSKIAIALFLILVSLGISVVRADTGWIRNPTNPVLLPSATGWDDLAVLFPRLLYNGTGYQMWYTGAGQTPTTQPGPFYRIGYATSSDGVHWIKSASTVLLPGPAGSWDSDSVASPSILYNGSVYMMWYVGVNGYSSAWFYWWMYQGVQSFGLATSADGISWTKYAGNPVMKGSGIDSFVMYSPWVLRVGNQFKMWYTCVGGTHTSYSRNSELQICYAVSPDGIHWTKNASPILNGTGLVHGWDSYGVYAPSVLYDGHVYGMWYSGYNYVGNPPSQGISQIGYATSLDGVTWSRAAGNPILGPGSGSSWDSYAVDHPCVIEIKLGTFRLYFTGYASTSQAIPNEIGFAESPAGFVLPELASPTIFVIMTIALASGAVTLTKRQSNKNR